MPKVSRQHQEARKNQIIEAAITCFSQKGFHRTSMQDIVAESGLSPGAIYLYFDSKEEIIKTIAATRHAKEKEIMAKAFHSQNAGKALTQLVDIFFNSLLDTNTKQQRIMGVQLWGEALSNPSVYEIVRHGIDEPIRVLTELVTEYQKQKLLPQELSPEAIARVILAQFQGFVLQFVMDEQLDIQEYIKAVHHLINHS
ncbi:TetR/AcrR family transcriptional regulator [Desulfosporosinus sp. PR]|uniref:TetR/AcrR family transcriptional regulator n=1 Tax=Candidatus Desulfosporosinus nitrosoreducens TaxID=3401928 RepID=UPI0027FA9CB6|nr:TetR/AcrR family transcriptional regulator [Desulfosporosinus sp. PR]MDQ7097025.1 TetR/AcrR family transcriptional regulator [Desulfosporosinus sp. PR]